MSKIWYWPLPDYVPRSIPQDFGTVPYGSDFRVCQVFIHNCPPQQPVCAVEEGKVLLLSPEALYIEGTSGVVVYGTGWLRRSEIKVGQEIHGGDYLGTVGVDGLFRLTLYNTFPQKTALEKASTWAEDLPKTWAKDDPKPEGLLDPTPQLVQAWTMVTERFHREDQPVPQLPEERLNLLAWLMNHSLWTHPQDHLVPPNEKDPNSWLDENNFMRSPGPDWILKTEDDGGGSFQECVDFYPVCVDPTCERVVGQGSWSDDPKNTAFRVWVEAGGWGDRSRDPNIPEPEGGWNNWNQWHSCHDINLDCGAASMEDALLELALRVKWYYGDNRELKSIPPSCGFEEKLCSSPDENGEPAFMVVSSCVDAGDGFCQKCGYLIEEYSSIFATENEAPSQPLRVIETKDLLE